jgi:hypothetical protein
MISQKEGYYQVCGFISVGEEMSPEEKASREILMEQTVNYYKCGYANMPLGKDSNRNKLAKYFNITEFPTYLVLDNEGIVFRSHRAEEVIEFIKKNANKKKS